MNKKAIQLSVNFIVILIIALVVFSFGIKIAYDVMAHAEEIREDVDENTQREIEAALTGGNIVSIPINHKESKIGTSVTFGIGIFNMENTQSFTIEMSYESAYNQKTKAPIEVNGEEWILNNFGPYEIARNDQKTTALPVKIPRNVAGGKTPPGIYSFNVKVKNGSGWYYGPPQKVRVTVI